VLGCVALAERHNSSALKKAEQLTVAWFSLCESPSLHTWLSRLLTLLQADSFTSFSKVSLNQRHAPSMNLPNHSRRVFHLQPRQHHLVPVPLRTALEGIRPLRLALHDLGSLHALHRDPDRGIYSHSTAPLSSSSRLPTITVQNS
jgi:hypothetical protein